MHLGETGTPLVPGGHLPSRLSVESARTKDSYAHAEWRSSRPLHPAVDFHPRSHPFPRFLR